jgi:ceramide glucosyltransferase
MTAMALWILAAAGVVVTSLQVVLVARLRRKRRPFVPAGLPAGSLQDGSSEARLRVSVLKPLKALDDALEENLASFAALGGVSYEVILSAESEADPAVPVARKVMARYPEAPFRLVVGGPRRTGVSNPKVERLVAAERAASGEILFVSDSNVRVGPDDVRATVALFDDPSVGCVSNLFVGDGARSLGAIVESLHLLTFVLPGTALAEASGVPCVIGKSMAISRRALEAVGGFAAFLDVLAEDQAIGVAVRKAGFAIVVSPVVVRNVVVSRTLRSALARQARWNKIRWSFSKPLYAGELLLNPFPVSLLACGAAALTAPALLPFAAVLAGLVSLVRMAQTAALARLTGARLAPWHLLVVPAKDVLQLGCQFAPLLSREVSWHGHRARLGPGTLLLPSRREPALAA